MEQTHANYAGSQVPKGFRVTSRMGDLVRTRMPVQGRFLLHWSNRSDWRLRNDSEHRIDPGWEDGEYSHCHSDVRPLIAVGTWIFDVVPWLNEDGRREAVVRSAFRIESKEPSAVLRFDKFYFADSKPIPLPGHFIQYRKQCIAPDRLRSLLDELRDRYALYSKGERPRSISLEKWKLMNKIRRNALGRPHKCD